MDHYVIFFYKQIIFYEQGAKLVSITFSTVLFFHYTFATIIKAHSGCPYVIKLLSPPACCPVVFWPAGCAVKTALTCRTCVNVFEQSHYWNTSDFISKCVICMQIHAQSHLHVNINRDHHLCGVILNFIFITLHLKLLPSHVRPFMQTMCSL